MTLRDIATTDGVGKSTASRIINRHLDLGTHSQKKWETVKELKKIIELINSTRILKITLSRQVNVFRHLLATGDNTDS